MKPIVIVCGANHSKTSMLMEILIDLDNDSLWFGDVSEDKHEKTQYDKYENVEFADICKQRFNADYKKKDSKGFKQFFKSVPKDKIVILKHPKSIFLMNEIKEAVGKREVRIVYVFRDLHDVIISTSIKNEPKRRLSIFEDMQRMLGYAEYIRRSLFMSFQHDCFYCPTTYFESYPRKPLNERLLNYILS